MRQYYPKWGRIFLAPETGGGSGGSTANPGSQQAGGQEVKTGSEPIDPYANLNFDDYDPEVAKILKAGKESFASLQEQKKKDDEARVKAEQDARRFQSQFDQLQAQVQKLNGNGSQPAADPKADRLDKFTKILIAKGVPEAQAKVQAGTLLELMVDYGEALKSEIGQSLTPFASTLLSRDAEMAWVTATQSDKVGAMQIPVVQQTTWEQVKTMVQNGQQVTPAVIKNLVGMAYLNYLESDEGQKQQQQQQTQPIMPQFPSIGRSTVPGGGASPYRPQVADPNAPKYTLDADTNAALQVVLKKWTTDKIKPPGLIKK